MTRHGRLNEGERAALAVALSTFVFVMDMAAPAAGFALLHAPVLGVLYGARRTAVAACGAFAVFLIVAGAVLGPAPAGWELAASRTILALVVALVVIAAVVMSSREAALREQALIDPLTGVLNRRCFFEMSGKVEARNRRNNGNLAVLMIDIDHFKQVNDTHGHPVGDEVLRGMAAVCAETLRPSDIVARYGGEEFVVSLPDTDQAEAARVAERMRAAIQSRTFTGATGAFSVTASIGVSSCANGLTLNDALGLADAALYRAKRGGRNRVEAAPIAAQPVAAQPVATRDAQTNQGVILVVDDDDDFRSVLAHWLRDEGYDVATADGADDALQQLRSNPAIDLVITDVVMPGGLAGFELGRRAEQIRPGIKLMYMSGHAAAQAARTGTPSAPPLMQKPFRLAHLVETVEAVLHH